MATLQAVSLDHAGANLIGQIAVPDGPGPHPGILVMHNAHGLGERMLDVAQSWAQRGYVALATDMYGGGMYHRDPGAAGSAIEPLWKNPELLRSRVVAWYEQLKARPEVDASRLGAVGYCFGGQCVLELARSGANVNVVVSYHGLLATSTPAKADEVKARVVVYTGAEDPYVPHAHVEALQNEFTAAGAAWQVTVFSDAAHGFTDPDAALIGRPGHAYNLAADKISWAGTEALFQALL